MSAALQCILSRLCSFARSKPSLVAILPIKYETLGDFSNFRLRTRFARTQTRLPGPKLGADRGGDFAQVSIPRSTMSCL
jgi:hypothetical protein